MKKPETLEEFRKAIAATLREAGHEALAWYADDVDLEDAMTAPWLRAWDFIRDEERLMPSEPDGFWADFDSVVHDAVLEAEAEYRNPLNTAPGFRAIACDAGALADEVTAALAAGRPAKRVVQKPGDSDKKGDADVVRR